ncbi:hypothetical protein Tco_0669328 [Tanacetum coccineum]
MQSPKVRAGHSCNIDRFSMSWLATDQRLCRRLCHISGALTDEAVRNGSIKKVEKSGNVGEPIKDKNGRDDNKRTRIVNAFATTVNPVGRENAAVEIEVFGSDYRLVDKNQEEIVVVRDFPEFLGHVINGKGIPSRPYKNEAKKNGKPLEHLTEGLVSTMSTADHPQTDGRSEHIIQTFEDMLRASVLADPTLQVPLDEIRFDTKLNFVEDPVEILEKELKKLKRSRIAIVMFGWNSKTGPSEVNSRREL